MLHKDLTTSFPRSVHDRVLGVVMLGRCIDKGIAFANGKNGEYNFDCPMDKAVLGLLGVDANELLATIKRAASQEEILAYLKPFVDRTPPSKIEEFNRTFPTSGPQPGSDGEKRFLELRNAAAPDRTDVTAWADLLDLDERRSVPVRTAA